MTSIGRLTQVELRKLWKHEEYDFSSWLALPLNLGLLSDEIGVSLTDPQKETAVGKFSADIVAEEEGTGRRVLIENQLETTNHDHLGKLITYGAGMDASILIWIVKKAREEHERAITWMNEKSDDSLNIFLIQIEAWRIGDSEPAPRFNIIAKPNDWAKMVKHTTRENTISEYNLLQQRFWEGLVDYDKKGVVGNRKVQPHHWYDVSIGSSSGHISLTVNKNDNSIGCELYIAKDADKEIFDSFYENKLTIESKLQVPIEWMRLEHRKASRIKASFSGDVLNENEWSRFYDWYLDTVLAFKKVFGGKL